MLHENILPHFVIIPDMGGWTVDTYLELARIIGCSTAAEGKNFDSKSLMAILNEANFPISEGSLKRMLERNSCFGGRGPQKLKGCPLLEGEKCTFIPSSTWSRRK